VFNIPLAEVVTDYFDQLKSRSKGYASMEYKVGGGGGGRGNGIAQGASQGPAHPSVACPALLPLACSRAPTRPKPAPPAPYPPPKLTGYQRNDLVLLEVRINGEPAEPLSVIVHRDSAYRTGKALCLKLKELIPRQMFKVPIQVRCLKAGVRPGAFAGRGAAPATVRCRKPGPPAGASRGRPLAVSRWPPAPTHPSTLPHPPSPPRLASAARLLPASRSRPTARCGSRRGAPPAAREGPGCPAHRPVPALPPPFSPSTPHPAPFPNIQDVLAKCYGGDISRKKKLLSKQAAGKKRMKAIGKVEVPQAAFMAVLNINTADD
jgi:hypothetical protein